MMFEYNNLEDFVRSVYSSYYFNCNPPNVKFNPNEIPIGIFSDVLQQYDDRFLYIEDSVWYDSNQIEYALEIYINDCIVMGKKCTYKGFLEFLALSEDSIIKSCEKYFLKEVAV